MVGGAKKRVRRVENMHIVSKTSALGQKKATWGQKLAQEVKNKVVRSKTSMPGFK